MRMTLLPFCIFILTLSCSQTEKSHELQTTPNALVKQIELKEYRIDSLSENQLEYHYIESFTPDGFLERSITIFGYDEDIDSNIYLFDTIYYTHKSQKNHVDYFIEGDLAEKEIRKHNRLYVYGVENLEKPMIVREFDKRGNMAKELVCDNANLYVREFEITQKDYKGFASEALAYWAQYIVTDDFDFETLNYTQLEKIDSSIYRVEFRYLLN